MPESLDVGLQEIADEIGFHARAAAEMDDRVHADDRAIDRGAIRDVAHVSVVRARRGLEVEGSERAMRLEAVENSLADIAGGTGDEDELGRPRRVHGRNLIHPS